MKRIGPVMMSAALIAGMVACTPTEKRESNLNIQCSEQATTVATVESVHMKNRMVK